MASSPKSLVGAALAKTGMDAAVRSEIEAIRADLDANYRDRFIALTESISRQASALDRIQHTLQLLLEKSAPELMGRIPGLAVATDGSDPDLATIAVADPIGQGYSLSQQAIADALKCSQSDVSILLKAFPLRDNPRFAVVVRSGKTRDVVNYHRRAIDELLRIVEKPPTNASSTVAAAVRRIRARRNSSPSV